MDHDFIARSRFVQPMFFGDGSSIAPGDHVELRLDEVRLRVRVDEASADGFSGTVTELRDDTHAPESHAGLNVGATVRFREEHVRSCWKSAAA